MILPLIITIALAEYAARDDFKQIGKGSKIRHGIQWLFRASVVFAACCLSMPVEFRVLAQFHWPESAYALIKITGMSIGLAGLFSAYFRWRLNTLRELDWRYVSPSSWYDWTFLQLTVLHALQNREHYVPYSYQRYLDFEHYRNRVHRAGTMAYIFEALLFVGVVVLYLRSL